MLGTIWRYETEEDAGGADMCQAEELQEGPLEAYPYTKERKCGIRICRRVGQKGAIDRGVNSIRKFQKGLRRRSVVFYEGHRPNMKTQLLSAKGGQEIGWGRKRTARNSLPLLRIKNPELQGGRVLLRKRRVKRVTKRETVWVPGDAD